MWDSDTAHTYAWDANGRPVTIDSVGLTYDALGRMAEQDKGGVYTEIAYAPMTGPSFCTTVNERVYITTSSDNGATGGS